MIKVLLMATGIFLFLKFTIILLMLISALVVLVFLLKDNNE